MRAEIALWVEKLTKLVKILAAASGLCRPEFALKYDQTTGVGGATPISQVLYAEKLYNCRRYVVISRENQVGKDFTPMEFFTFIRPIHNWITQT